MTTFKISNFDCPFPSTFYTFWLVDTNNAELWLGEKGRGGGGVYMDVVIKNFSFWTPPYLSQSEGSIICVNQSECIKYGGERAVKIGNFEGRHSLGGLEGTSGRCHLTLQASDFNHVLTGVKNQCSNAS